MQNYHVIGIMSGTSLDGLDIVLCNFKFTDKWSFKIIKCETIEYDNKWKSKLKESPNLSAYSLQKLNKDYGEFIGNCILNFTRGISSKIDLIASHGHTVFHQPEKMLTLQIGNGAQICSITGITTISDFRSLDISLGGQGAPLVPVGDKLLFGEYNYCINIGGFANVSFEKNKERFAYDICPANIILNYLSTKLGYEFDDQGNLGKTGNINTELLMKLDALAFYHKPFPKSLGKEWLEEFFMPALDNSKVSLTDKMATLYEHISNKIAESINEKTAKRVLITGGGAYNSYLIECIKDKTNNEICIPGKNIIEYKEALIFGLLGILRLNKQDNCLASVTGARKNSSGGVIYLA